MVNESTGSDQERSGEELGGIGGILEVPLERLDRNSSSEERVLWKVSPVKESLHESSN